MGDYVVHRRTRGAGRPKAVPLSDLPSIAQALSEETLQDNTRSFAAYHLRAYETWAASEGVPMWPLTLEKLLSFGGWRAIDLAFHTVREGMRIVSMVHRKMTGEDLYVQPEVAEMLQGLRRSKPPKPVRPLRTSEVDRLFSYHPKTASQEQMRDVLLLSYASGFTLKEHVDIEIPQLEFVDDGIWIHELKERPLFFVGRAKQVERCPVNALRRLAGARLTGSVVISSHSKRRDRGFSYGGLARDVALFGIAAGFSPLSIDRVRYAGMVEMARRVDLIRLANFHGYKHPDHLAKLLSRHGIFPSFARWRQHDTN